MQQKHITMQVDFLNHTDYKIEIPIDEEDYSSMVCKILNSLTDSRWLMVPRKNEDKAMTLLQVDNITKVKIFDSSDLEKEGEHEAGSD